MTKILGNNAHQLLRNIVSILLTVSSQTKMFRLYCGIILYQIGVTRAQVVLDKCNFTVSGHRAGCLCENQNRNVVCVDQFDSRQATPGSCEERTVADRETGSRSGVASGQ